MHVVNLGDIAIEGKYTWKDIRDVLIKTYKGGWSSVRSECFGFHLLYPKAKESPWFSQYMFNHRDLFQSFSIYAMDGDTYECSEAKLFFDEAIRLSNGVRDLLHSHGMIEQAEDRDNMWSITERGKGLCRQRYLRRISKKEAGKKLARVLAAAKAFNENTFESHAISRIILFGSLLQDDVVDVGDIDIMIGLSRRYNGMSFDEWMDNERVMLYCERPSVFHRDPYATREDNARRSLQKITPYLSVEPFCSIDQFKKEGVPMAIIFAAEPDERCSDLYAKMRGVNIGSHQDAVANRAVLAGKLDCPELIKEIWDKPLS